jgi:hypothetical protein
MPRRPNGEIGNCERKFNETLPNVPRGHIRISVSISLNQFGQFELMNTALHICVFPSFPSITGGKYILQYFSQCQSGRRFWRSVTFYIEFSASFSFDQSIFEQFVWDYSTIPPCVWTAQMGRRVIKKWCKIWNTFYHLFLSVCLSASLLGLMMGR